MITKNTTQKYLLINKYTKISKRCLLIKKILSISWQNMLLKTKNTKAVTAKGSFWQVYVLFRKVNLGCAVYQSHNKLQLGQINKEKFRNHVFHQPCNIKYQPKEFHIFAMNQMKMGLAWQEGFLICSHWWYTNVIALFLRGSFGDCPWHCTTHQRQLNDRCGIGFVWSKPSHIVNSFKWPKWPETEW